MKFWKALKWLFTKAPYNITTDDENRVCDYCGENNRTTYFAETGMTICDTCVKRIADIVLTNKGVKP